MVELIFFICFDTCEMIEPHGAPVFYASREHCELAAGYAHADVAYKIIEAANKEGYRLTFKTIHRCKDAEPLRPSQN